MRGRVGARVRVKVGVGAGQVRVRVRVGAATSRQRQALGARVALGAPRGIAGLMGVWGASQRTHSATGIFRGVGC